MTKRGDEQLSGVVNEEVEFSGTLSFEHTLHFNGKLDGLVLAKDILQLGPAGSIKGRLYGRMLYVDGLVEGELVATQRLEIMENARIFGKVFARTVFIQPGAEMAGECSFGPYAAVRIEAIQQEYLPVRKAVAAG